MVEAVPAVEGEGGLRRALGSGQLAMIAIGGAIGTGLFLGSGFAISLAGPSVLLSYALGAIIALLLMGCLAEMTIAHPSSGSFGFFAQHYVGPMAGFLVRYSYFSCLVLAIGTEVTAVAIYMKYWLPAAPGWWWIVGFSALLVALNASSVRVFGSIEYVFSAIKIAAIAAFILLGAWILFGATKRSGMGIGNYVSDGGFLPNGLWGAWVAVIVAIFSYFSIEMIAVAAGEAEEPERAIVRAFRVTFFRLAFFYLATLALMLAIVPWRQAGAGGSPFVIVMAATGIAGAAGLINFVILIAALSAMNSQLYAASRMLFSLARAGQAPRVFGAISSRGVPLAALGLSTLGMGLAGLVYALEPARAFTSMIAVSSFGAMFTWAMIFISHLRFRKARRDAGGFRMWGYPYTSLLGAGLIFALLGTTVFTAEFRLTLVYGLPFLGLLVLAYVVWARARLGGAAEPG